MCDKLINEDNELAIVEAAAILKHVILDRYPPSPVPIDIRIAAESWLVQWLPRFSSNVD